MAELQTLSVAAMGGLDLVSPTQVLAQKPGTASTLVNYEPLPEGGYRRIKGYTRYGDIPDAFDGMELRGIAYYHGIVVVVGEYVLHSPNGATWYVVNKKGLKEKPVKDTDTVNLELMPRKGSGPVEFQVFLEGDREVCVITDAESLPSILHYDVNHYQYEETETTATKGYRYVTKYQDHVVVAGSIGSPGSIAVSTRFKATDYSGTGSWGAQVADEITGLKVFRDYLYVFCRHSIYRVVNLESKANAAIRPVTTKVGCVDGRTIQEIGGDILFLADDGLRYLGATERLDDVSLNVVSFPIRDLVASIDVNQGPISSVVLPRKGQYRLFFTTSQGRKMGIIGTLSGEGSFTWGTLDDMNVIAMTDAKVDNTEVVYHLGAPTIGNARVYQHDVGINFDGTPFVAEWATPYFHMGDSGIRKALHDIDIYLEADDKAEIELTVKLDHENYQTIQPEPFILAPVTRASRYGEFRYGEGAYGAIRYPLDAIFLEGSGKWIQLIFRDIADNATYTIRGYDLQFNASGRI